jgi:SAM-dependent methyltransferase
MYLKLMLSKIFGIKGTELHKKKSVWSTFKNAYLRSADFKKHWKKLDKKNLSRDLIEITDLFLSSESYNLTSKFWRHLIILHYDHLIKCGSNMDPQIDILKSDYSGFSYLDNFTINGGLKNSSKNVNINGNIFKKHEGMSSSESLQYNLVLLLLYENIKNKKIFNSYDLIKKNIYEKYNPCLSIDNKIYSQNMIISLLEYEKIELLTKKERGPLKILEVGAGYGRTANMIISLMEDVKYVIADLPLSIYFSQKNIKETFKNKKIQSCININNKTEMKKAFENNDVIFILPHQLKLFDKKFFDLSISIGNLCEMEKKQIKYYMNIYENISKYLYIKVWDIAGLPYSFYTYYDANKKSDYEIKESWKEHFKNRCLMPNNIYEMGYEF